MDRWFNKVALVTGASHGIGQSITEKLAEHGMRVVACARGINKLNELAANVNKNSMGEVFPYRCDITNEKQVVSMFKYIKEKFGILHACINNAGLGLKAATLLDGKTEVCSFQIKVLIP